MGASDHDRGRSEVNGQRHDRHAVRAHVGRIGRVAVFAAAACLAAVVVPAGSSAAPAVPTAGQAPAAAATTPGQPGTPQPATTLFTENFDNGGGDTPELLTAYTGSSGMTYTADPQWLSVPQCNGVVLTYDSLKPAGACASTAAWPSLQSAAYSLAYVHGASDATAQHNHAVAAWTASADTGVGSLIFKNASPISVPSGSRFLTFAVDVAAVGCNAAHPKYEFFLDNGTAETALFDNAIDPCTDPGATHLDPIDHPFLNIGGVATQVWVGTFAGDAAQLFDGTQLNVVLRDGSGASVGNDAAFDNVQVLDATPQLDKSFAPASLPVGQPSTLTYTITNTDELAGKPGWSFTDDLPSGLTLAADPHVSSTCANPTVTAPAGGSSVTVHADLAGGAASCTVSVNVTSDTAGQYTNGPSNISAHVGVNLPADATVTFTTAPPVSLTKTGPAQAGTGEQFTYHLVASNAGPDDAPSTVVTDDLPADVTYVSANPAPNTVVSHTLTWDLGTLAANQSVPIEVTVTAPDHRESVTNTATITYQPTCTPLPACAPAPSDPPPVLTDVVDDLGGPLVHPTVLAAVLVAGAGLELARRRVRRRRAR